MNPRDQDNYTIFKAMTGTDESIFDRQDLAVGLEKAVPFIDKNLHAILEMVTRLNAWMIHEAGSESEAREIPTLMRLFTITYGTVSYLTGYAMGRMAERKDLTLDKILKPFEIKPKEE